MRIALDWLRAHPANPNRMDEEQLAKLAANIRDEHDYPPLVVRPHPEEAGCYQLLDGHQRWEVLRRLGQREATCYVWPCDDRTALLRELTELVSVEELSRLLPEDAGEIRRSLELLDLDLDRLLADLEQGAAVGSGLRAITFAVSAEEKRSVEAAVERATTRLTGSNRRGRALEEEPARIGLGRAPSRRSLEAWSVAFHWQDRLSDLERAAAEGDREDQLSALREMNERHAREGIALQQKAVERLQTLPSAELSASDAVRALSEGVRLERLARGAPTEQVRQEGELLHGHVDLRNFSSEELRRLVELAEHGATGAGEAAPG